MSNKLKCVMLVDDDSITNHIHKYQIEQSAVTDCIQVAGDGQMALEIITDQGPGNKHAINADCRNPDLILLDINMPRMNGWEFLEAYQKLNDLKQSKVIMLSTSVNTEDMKRAESNKIVSEYVVKPLDESKINHIMETYF